MLVRIDSVTKMQDFIKWRVAKTGEQLIEAVDVGRMAVEYIVADLAIAEERKLTQAMSNVPWHLRYKSDYVFVQENVFRDYCLDHEWHRTLQADKNRAFNAVNGKTITRRSTTPSAVMGHPYGKGNRAALEREAKPSGLKRRISAVLGTTKHLWA